LRICVRPNKKNISVDHLDFVFFLRKEEAFFICNLFFCLFFSKWPAALSSRQIRYRAHEFLVFFLTPQPHPSKRNYMNHVPDTSVFYLQTNMRWVIYLTHHSLCLSKIQSTVQNKYLMNTWQNTKNSTLCVY